MNIAVVKPSIVAALEAIPNIGIVDSEIGRTEGFPWQDVTSDRVLPLWVVSLHTEEDTEMGNTLGHVFREHTWHIRGYYPLNFFAGSSSSWDEYLDLVTEALSVSPKAIAVCARTFRPTIESNDFVNLQTGEQESIVCHYALIKFHTSIWKST